MTFQTERPLDDTDWQVLKELQADGRLSFHELGRRVGLSAPAVAERVRRLEEAGVIAGYQARVVPREQDCRWGLSSRCAVASTDVC